MNALGRLNVDLQELEQIEKSDDRCLICLEKMENGNSKTLPCKHTFHCECINLSAKYLKKNASVCPYCRQTYSSTKSSLNLQTITEEEWEQFKTSTVDKEVYIYGPTVHNYKKGVVKANTDAVKKVRVKVFIGNTAITINRKNVYSIS